MYDALRFLGQLTSTNGLLDIGDYPHSHTEPPGVPAPQTVCDLVGRISGSRALDHCAACQPALSV